MVQRAEVCFGCQIRMIRQNPFVHGGKLPIGLFGFAEIRVAVGDTRWSLADNAQQKRSQYAAW